MAEDTVEVLLNGSLPVPFGALGADGHCADSTLSDMVSLSGVTLLNGNNLLTFVVEQAGEEGGSVDPSGLDFTASLSAPEPSSLILLGIGLLGGAGLLFRRRRNQAGLTPPVRVPRGYLPAGGGQFYTSELASGRIH